MSHLSHYPSVAKYAMPSLRQRHENRGCAFFWKALSPIQFLIISIALFNCKFRLSVRNEETFNIKYSKPAGKSSAVFFYFFCYSRFLKIYIRGDPDEDKVSGWGKNSDRLMFLS
jgi:hypothetical protein